jgi:poly-gamma-glutamate synthesis protein (capsule biosynthesis protein)
VHRDPGLVGVVPASAVDPTVRVALVGGVDPLRQPARYRPTTPAPPAREEPGPPVTVTVVGDVMLARGVTDPAAALAPLAPRLRGADVTVGNLESTLSRAGAPTQGGDSFGADPGVVEPLRRAGFDALSLANNHAGDFGEQAMLTTVRRLRAAGLRPFGAGQDLRAAGTPVVVTREGVRFGFLGFNAIGETPRATPGSAGALSVRMPPRTGPLQESDLRQVTTRVRSLDSRADVVVVLPHWGTQYTHVPEPVQRVVSRRLVDAGADLVVGGHPHWVQGLDRVGDAVVVHSLGNFVFDMDFMTQTLQGVVLEATFWGGTLKAVDLVPYRMGPGFAPRPASVAEGREILADVWSTSTGPFRTRR